MSLLRDIQGDIAKSDADVPTILRKCKILAHRLKSAELSAWVDHELDGYPADSEVPPYRELRPHYYANFMNMAWSAKRTAIPIEALDNKYHDSLAKMDFRDGIATVAGFAEKGGMVDQTRMIPLIQGKFYPEMHCQTAWAELSPSQFQHILSAVKNRVLDFVLKIEAENPDAGEDVAAPQPVAPDRVEALVSNVFYGPVGNVAQQNKTVTQTARIDMAAIENLVRTIDERLEDLHLDEQVERRARAQITTIMAQLQDEPNPTIVREAGRTLRSLIEGAAAGMIGNAAQPTVWAWVHSMMASLF